MAKKAIVVKNFNDRYFGREFKKGEEYPAWVASERLQELMQPEVNGNVGPFIQVIHENYEPGLTDDESTIAGSRITGTEDQQDETDDQEPEFNIETATVAELKEELEERGVEYPAKATKDELKALFN